jgi:hypothetical protein
MKINRIIFNVFLPMLALVFILGACQKNEDLLTADAKTGGLAIATGSVPYKLGATPSVPLTLDIPMGPGISKIEVFNQYFSTATGNKSAKILMSTVDIASGNASADIEKAFSINYQDLSKDITIDGAALPADENLLPIGDKWVLTYESIMAADGRRVVNNANTTIAVANLYAGYYSCTGVFTHPTAGPRDIDETKFLTPVNAYSCSLPAGDLGAAGYFVTITVDPATNDISFSNGIPTEMLAQPGMRSYYDPETGHIFLHYFYVGSSGSRLIDEEYAPL